MPIQPPRVPRAAVAMAALRAAWVQGQPLEAAIETGRAWGLQGLEPAVRQRIRAGAR